MSSANKHYTKTSPCDIIQRPHISEKAVAGGGDRNLVVFRIAPWANKKQVKDAMVKLFKVKVEKVNICRIAGKSKLFKNRPGKRKAITKAYVRLAEGSNIDSLVEQSASVEGDS